MIVLTANYGEYDASHRLPLDAVVYDESRRNNAILPGRYVAKAVKCAPHLLGHLGRDIVWVDGSMEWTGKSLGSLLEQVPLGGVGVFRHRERDCIYAEAEASIENRRRYMNEPIAQQAEHYRAMGHPAHDGLWETGLIVWRGAQRWLGAPWLAEMLAWSSQDQISFPYVARDSTSMVTDLSGGDAWKNEWFEAKAHLR